MARYMRRDRSQLEMMVVDLRAQIVPGSFEAALDAMVDSHVDLSVFDAAYCNDETGRLAYHPGVMLKIILYAYSQGLYSSRRIERACRENITFMALSGRATPDHSTGAAFITNFRDSMISVFRDILWVADQEGLIGRSMFAIDGCKLPSNASKDWSGTFDEFAHKIAKLEGAIAHRVDRHQAEDADPLPQDELERQQTQIQTLRRQVAKYRAYMDTHEERLGASGKPVKSNITDPESAKIKTSKGVIQGYTGLTTVDADEQIIVSAQAEGIAQEQISLWPVIESTKANLQDIDPQQDEDQHLKETTITADAGFHSEANLQQLEEEHIDACIADNRFRKRDPRFNEAERHKPQRPPSKKYRPEDFIHDELRHTCLCPAGKRLYLSQRHAISRDGTVSVRYMGAKRDCEPCHLRSRCLKDEKQNSPRQVAFFKDRPEPDPETATARMKRKIDSDAGRAIYAKRLGTVEPPFGRMQTMGFRRFNRRGREKVNAEWLLMCTVHNMQRIHSCTKDEG